MIRPYDGGITGEWCWSLRWGGLRVNGVGPYDGGMTGGMVLKILPPVVQNGLNIPREGAFLHKGVSMHRHTNNVRPRWTSVL